MEPKYKPILPYLMVILLLGLAACDTQHKTDYRVHRPVAAGAVTGAVAGLAIGAATSGTIPLAIAGGLVAGGVIGHGPPTSVHRENKRKEEL